MARNSKTYEQTKSSKRNMSVTGLENDQVPRGMQLHRESASSSVNHYKTDWEQKYKTWKREDDSLHSFFISAQPPCKDFVQVYVTPFELILRQWPMIPPIRSGASQSVPREEKLSYEQFEALSEEEEGMKATILHLMGRSELDYINNLINGQIDYLDRLPKSCIVKIMTFLDLSSVSRLSQINRLCREVGNSNKVWAKFYMDYSGKQMDYVWMMMADTIGFKAAIVKDRDVLQRIVLKSKPQIAGASGKAGKAGKKPHSGVPGSRT